MLAGFGPYAPLLISLMRAGRSRDRPSALRRIACRPAQSASRREHCWTNVRSKRAVDSSRDRHCDHQCPDTCILPRLPPVFIGLVAARMTGGFLGPAIAASSLAWWGNWRSLNESGVITVSPPPAPGWRRIMGVAGYLLSYMDIRRPGWRARRVSPGTDDLSAIFLIVVPDRTSSVPCLARDPSGPCTLRPILAERPLLMMRVSQ